MIKSVEDVRSLTLDSSNPGGDSTSPLFDLKLISRLRNLEALEVAGTWRVAEGTSGNNLNTAIVEGWTQQPQIQLPRLKTVVFLQATIKLVQLVVQSLDSPILGTLILHSYSRPPFSNLARDKRELPELKLPNGRIIPVIRIQTAWVQDLPPLVQKIPSYAQHKLELCVLAPRLRSDFFTMDEFNGTNSSPARMGGSLGTG